MGGKKPGGFFVTSGVSQGWGTEPLLTYLRLVAVEVSGVGND